MSVEENLRLMQTLDDAWSEENFRKGLAFFSSFFPAFCFPKVSLIRMKVTLDSNLPSSKCVLNES